MSELYVYRLGGSLSASIRFIAANARGVARRAAGAIKVVNVAELAGTPRRSIVVQRKRLRRVAGAAARRDDRGERRRRRLAAGRRLHLRQHRARGRGRPAFAYVWIIALKVYVFGRTPHARIHARLARVVEGAGAAARVDERGDGDGVGRHAALVQALEHREDVRELPALRHASSTMLHACSGGVSPADRSLRQRPEASDRRAALSPLITAMNARRAAPAPPRTAASGGAPSPHRTAPSGRGR